MTEEVKLVGKYGVIENPHQSYEDGNKKWYFKRRALNLYPSQIRFIFSRKSEVLMSGGFGCITGDTKLLTKDGEVEIEKLVNDNKAPIVLAFNGKDFEWTQAEVPYLKSYEDTLRINTDGTFIEVAKNHYFLTLDGWKAASSCVVGERLLAYSPVPALSNSEFCHSVLPQGVFHSNHTSEDFQCDYPEHYGFYDGQLLYGSNICQDVSPSLTGALEHILQNSHKDVHGIELNDNPSYQYERHFSKNYLGSQHNPLNQRQFPSCLRTVEDVHQCSCSNPVHNLQRSVLSSSHSHTSQDISVDHYAKGISDSKDNSFLPFCDQASYGSPYLVTHIIQEIKQSHRKNIYDIGVPKHHNYVAQGLIHHNSGKSLALCVKAAIEACKPGNIVMMCRKSFTDLESTTLRTLIEGDGKSQPVLPYGSYKYLRSERRLDIRGGGTIYLVGFDDPMKMGSYNAGCVCIDEAWQIDDKEYAALGKRCRNDIGSRQMMLVTNPSTYGHFLYKKFYSERGSANVETIEACSEENVYLPQDYINNHLKKQCSTQQEYDNILMGRWVAQGKLVYPQWNDKYIVNKKEINYPYYYVAVDYGYTNEMAMIFCGVTEDNDVHIIDEFYKSHALHNDVYQKLDEWNDYAPTIIVDPSAALFIAELDSRGANAIKAENAIEVGIGRVRNLLANKKITVESKCKNFLNEIYGYTLEENGKPVKIHDHLMDTLKYLANYLLSPEMNQKAPKLFSYEDWVSKEHRKLVKSGDLEELARFKRETSGNMDWFDPVAEEMA